MTLFELINAIDSDSMIITINGKSAILFKKGQGDNILEEKWRIEEGDILNLSKELLGAKVTNYAMKIMVGEVPQVEVSLEGIEPCPEEEEYETYSLKSLLSLFVDQNTRICIIRSGIGRIYTGPISGFLASVSDVYKTNVLDSVIEKVYNETAIDDNEDRKTTFFIRIGGTK